MIDSLQAEFGIPQAVSITEGINDMPKVVLSHMSGSGTEVYLHGAHVTSWTDSKGEELFIVSRAAYFEDGRPIRGGIPVIFPQFSEQGPLPPHGIARTREWQLIHTEVLANGVITAKLQLTDNPKTFAIWPHKFVISLEVRLSRDDLTLAMEVENSNDQPFEFQMAFHTYFEVADIKQTAVHGLEGVTLIDSMRDNIREAESRSAIRFSEETDRIYVDAPDTLSLDDEGHGRTICIAKKNMPDVVVWNPWIAKSQRMTDFGDDEYLRMVCIETGSIETRPRLLPGGRWRGETRFSINSNNG